MPPDYNFIANPQQTNGMALLSSMLDMAGKAQSLQRGNIGLQLERATLQPKIERTQAEAETAKTGAQSAAFGFQKDQASTALNEAAGLLNDPGVLSSDPTKTADALVSARERAIAKGVPKAQAEILFGNLLGLAHTPDAVVQQLRNIATAHAGAAAQSSIANAPIDFQGNGQQNIAVQRQPGAPGAIQPGQSIQMQPPPATQTFNPRTNAYELYGPRAPSGAPVAPIQSAPALGAQATQEGIAATVKNDWDATVAAGSKAAQNIGVLQEIKKYAPGAITGVTGDRRAFLAGLAGLVGIDATQLEKTDTDLLAKNANMVALAGGNTDLARTLAEVANPNVHMTKEAIEKASNQVIAQQQLAIARQQFLEPFRGDAGAYTKAMTQFNAVADPRILQLRDMSIADKSKMKAAMSPQEQKDFSAKIRAMYQMGILK